VNDETVSLNYGIKSNDLLSHVTHRHEPAVLVSKKCMDQGRKVVHPIMIVAETEDVLVVEKPSTMPTHPCGTLMRNYLAFCLFFNLIFCSDAFILDMKPGKGGYHLNSLFQIIMSFRPDLKDRLFAVQRLDRLTSGLVIIAKSSAVAKEVGISIRDRTCEKLYLARVRGKFPLNANKSHYCSQMRNQRKSSGDNNNNNNDDISNTESDKTKELNHLFPVDGVRNDEAASEYWICSNNNNCGDTSEHVINTLFSKCDEMVSQKWNKDAVYELKQELDCRNEGDVGRYFLEIACPCKISSHKDGVCIVSEKPVSAINEEGWKPAQTRFHVVAYDEATDTTVLLAQPITGRTHQIRLHLQCLGHPIANDPNYGGDLFYANELGKANCEKAQSLLLKSHHDSPNGDTDSGLKLISDTPATEAEIRKCGDFIRLPNETLVDYVKRTCVWCNRRKDEASRNVLELRTRSHGIWLHALSFKYGSTRYSTQDIPSWAFFK